MLPYETGEKASASVLGLTRLGFCKLMFLSIIGIVV